MSKIDTGWWLKNHLQKYESPWEGLSHIHHILWKIKNVWNHQPGYEPPLTSLTTADPRFISRYYVHYLFQDDFPMRHEIAGDLQAFPTFSQTGPITHTHTHIYRAEAGGSPEANCNLFVWIWKMLILYRALQCFLPSLESVPSVKVSMSARINSEFVRAEKW